MRIAIMLLRTVVVFAALAGVTDASAADGPAPKDFRGVKWGAAPTKDLKRFSGPHHGAEKLEMWVPKEPAKAPPWFGIPVHEEDYNFTRSRLHGGDLFFEGEQNFAAVKAQLKRLYGTPDFANDKFQIYRWEWSNPKITVILSYSKTSATVSIENASI